MARVMAGQMACGRVTVRRTPATRHSPDLNPIEQMFAKLKALLRKAAARSVETTWRHISELLTQFTPDECVNYLTDACYAST
jgi:transposase